MAEVKQLLGSERLPLISDHADEIRERSQSYGEHQRPEDYLDSFNAFIKQQLNQSAASIIGPIRRAALGKPLVPFEQRVTQAMQHIYQNHNFLPAQRRWLERLAKQLVHEVIIDREFVNNRIGDHGALSSWTKYLKIN